MKKIVVVLCLFLLVSCGQTQDDKSKIASVACSIMSETRNMDAATRVREMNDAREKIGGEPFLEGDDKITESLQYGLCTELVLNDIYEQSLKVLKDAEREKQKIADSKPSVIEEFHPNGQLALRQNRNPKNEGGELHGLSEVYYENGQLKSKIHYKDGKIDGLVFKYNENGNLLLKFNNKDGKYEGVFEEYYAPSGNIKSRFNFENGLTEGIAERYLESGEVSTYCFKNDEITTYSYCQN